jgi:hypothetical protein
MAEQNNFSGELSDTLRAAVEQARQELAPGGALRRSLERAQRIRPTISRSWLKQNRHHLAAAGIAALLLVGLWQTPRPAPEGEIQEGNSSLRYHLTDGSSNTIFDNRTLALVGPSDYLKRGEGKDFDKTPASAALDSLRISPESLHFGEREKELLDHGPLPDFEVNKKSRNSPPVIWSLAGSPDGSAISLSKDGYLERRKLWSEFTGLMPRRLDRVDKPAENKKDPDKLEKEKKLTTKPFVWKRDQTKPTFARVYLGGGNSLELVSIHVTVLVEGPRSRTLVDHVFRNPHDRQLEGTFEYPLPAGASPSYFGMFLGQTRDKLPPLFRRPGGKPLTPTLLAALTPGETARLVDSTDWGRLQEARIVAQDKAREAYENVVRQQIDPAVLEYAGGNTFRGRVFPIPAKGFNRVILAYEELLPVQRGRQVYRFPLPGVKLQEMKFTLAGSTKNCKTSVFSLAEAKKEEKGGFLSFSKEWNNAIPEGEVRFVAAPPREMVQATSGRNGDSGSRYLFARVRPRMPILEDAVPFAKHGVFLLDTSLSESPDRFAVSMQLLKNILEKDGELKHFNVLTFNAGAAWLKPTGWLPNTPAGRERAFARLDGLLLEGATDLSAALEKLCNPGFEVAKGTPLNCFLLSDGNLNWGETDVVALASRLEKRCPFDARFFCYRTGLGQENAELFDALARKGGGVFQCFGPAEVQAVATAHRRRCLQINRVRFSGGPEASDVLVAGRRAAVHPGGELVVAAKFNGVGRTNIIVEGTFEGRDVVDEFPVEVSDAGELAARGWGEIAVSSLLSLHDPRVDSLATAYCQEFGIASRAASFLVLENEADFQRLDLEKERGKTLRGDLGRYVEQAWRLRGESETPRAAFNRLLETIDARSKVISGPEGKALQELLGMLGDADFETPCPAISDAQTQKQDADKNYLQMRKKDRSDINVYTAEAARRAAKGDVVGAVRVLSTVVEEHAGRGEALRLVGYHLLALGQPAHAARLFAQVQKQRPFEPHSYRDLARALETAGRFGLAAVQYETVLAGTWHSRFGASLKSVVTEEYIRMMRQAIRAKAIRPKLLAWFGQRAIALDKDQAKSDLLVTISWNTDATDVDLWVIEPDGTKVFYSAPKSRNGGQLSADQTQGYGPERYRIAKAKPGDYTVVVHYYRPNPNLLNGETHVDVAISRNAGGAAEQVQRKTVILRKQNEQIEIMKVKF